MKTHEGRRAVEYVYGIVGPAILALGAIISAVPFRGREGETYSPFNHYISELGDPIVSTFASVFNIAMIAGGIAIALFMKGLGGYLKSRLGWAAAGGGFVAGTCCSLVGIFPMNEPSSHAAAAYSFFYSGLTSVALFIIVILKEREGRVAKWLSIPGIFALVCFVSFLAIQLAYRLPNTVLGAPDFVRPRIWPAAILEWSVFVAVIFWILLVSLHLKKINNASMP